MCGSPIAGRSIVWVGNSGPIALCGILASVSVSSGGVTLVPQLELRLLPTLHLGDVPVAYTDGSQEVERLSLRTSSLQLPRGAEVGSRALGQLPPLRRCWWLCCPAAWDALERTPAPPPYRLRAEYRRWVRPLLLLLQALASADLPLWLGEPSPNAPPRSAGRPTDTLHRGRSWDGDTCASPHALLRVKWSF